MYKYDNSMVVNMTIGGLHMNVITMINVKGGVGKTTITFNLAHALQKVNKSRVLLIDMDFQQNLTYKSMKDVNERSLTIYDLLSGEDTFISECIYDTHIPNIDIIPSELKFNTITDQIDVAKNPAVFTLLRNKLKALEEKYDYVLIDTHPNLDLITTISLLTSTYYLIPVKPEPDSVYGIEFTTNYANGIRKSNKKLGNLGIILTDVDRRTTLGMEMQETLDTKYPNMVLNTVIQRNVDLTKAAFENKTIFEYERRAPACVSFKELAEEIIAKCEVK